jgi:hypothetical protein
LKEAFGETLAIGDPGIDVGDCSSVFGLWHIVGDEVLVKVATRLRAYALAPPLLRAYRFEVDDHHSDVAESSQVNGLRHSH